MNLRLLCRGNPGRLPVCVIALLAGVFSVLGVDIKDAEAAAAAGDHEYAAIIATDLAKNGDAKAALFLANAYLNASGVDGDLNEAVKWFFRASDKGVAEAGHTLSLLRRKVFQSDSGDAVAAAIRKAFENYRRKELVLEFPDLEEDESGDSIGARLFKSGRKEEAVETLVREARALDPGAVIFLRIFYFNRVEGVPERDPRILAFFREAADEGDPKAREILGRILLEGGEGEDEEKGMEMLVGAKSEASQKLLVQAYLERGWEEKAAGVYREAGKLGSAWGNYEYAKLLLKDGLRDDAIPYLERTLDAEPGHWQATVKLGKALIERRRGLSDLSRGFDLYKRAADVGDDAVSQYVVGLLYLRGTGVPASKDDAVAYFAKAAKRGVAQAREELDKLTASAKPRMTASSSDVPEDVAVKAGAVEVAPKKKKAEPKPKARPSVHIVEEGDTFYGITLEYGISYLALRRANPGVNEARLRLGQKIKLPRK